jgi:hypothetical protein
MFCFSPHSIKLTTVVQWYLHLAIVLARDYDEVHLHDVQRLNTSCCVYGWIVILKNCIACMRHMDHSMHLVNWNVHLVTGSNSTFQRTSSIPRYSCPNHHRTTSVFHSWNQHSRLWASLGVVLTEIQPVVGNNMDDSFDHIMYLQSSDVQVLWSSHHIFHPKMSFSVIRSLGIEAVLLDIGFVKLV